MVGRVAGVPVAFSWSFAGVVLALVALAVSGVAVGIVVGSLAVVTIAALAHEVAHAVVARRRGFDVHGVVVSLVGGEATWSGATEPAAADVVAITAAGPAANALLVCASVPVLDTMWGQLFASVNLCAALVNLVPAPGLDGWVLWRAVRA